MITVILNGYKRPEYLETQLTAINNQTVKPEAIMLWQNAGGTFDKELTKNIIHVESNNNFGVWARFAFALNAMTEYVCIFDDDTIPGKKWLENCLNTIETHNGLLGTIGVQFQTLTGYQPIKRYGWADNHNDDVVEVDTVGHSWFFRREWLKYFWMEMPEKGDSLLVGEDMHFTFMLRKYADIKTFVPPHPVSDKDLWGSDERLGWVLGQDKNAISMNRDSLMKMNEMYINNIKKGFIPLKFQ